MKFEFYRILAAVLLLSAGGAFAQAGNQQTYKFKFRLISWDSVISDLGFLSGGEKPTAVNILPNSRSSFYEYEGPGPVVFGRTVTGPDGKPVFEVAATVPVKEFGERTLLMFFNKPGAPGQYNVTGFDDSDSAIPAGGYRFLNFTPNTLAVKCGDASGTMPPRGSLLLRSKTTDSPEIMPVEVVAKTDGGYQRAFASRWPYGATTRTLVFVYFVPETKSFALKKILEDVAAIPKPTPPPAP